jgi:hypothetical protein
MVSDCSHKAIRGLTILRHNDTVEVLGRCIQESPELCGGSLYMDAGIAAAASLKPQGDRPPGWLLTNLDTTTHTPDIPSTLPYRPDLLYIGGIQGAQYIPTTMADRSLHPIHVVEVGYCSDTRYQDKYLTKSQQHTHFLTDLRKAGWTQVHSHTLLIGNAGTIYKTMRTFLTKVLNLPSKDINPHILQMQQIAIRRGMQMVSTRRFLESQGLRAHPP